MIKKFTTLFLTTTILLSMVPSVFALEAPIGTIKANSVMASSYFSDINGINAKTDIEYLLGRDIVKGYENAQFRPDGHLTYAEALQLLTRSFVLKINEADQTRATHIEQNEWYSEAFNIAVANDITLDLNSKVNDNVTREQFAGWIIDELDRIGVYPVVRMYIHIADGEQISEQYAGKVQTLLLTRLANLSEDQMFRPQDSITRAEAADWLADAVKFADDLRAKQQKSLTTNLPFEFNAEMTLTEQQAQTLLHKAFDGDVASTSSNQAAKKVTREQLATWIVDELDKLGPYPVKMMFIHINDEQEITQDVSYKVHTLLLTDIAELDEAGNFRPQTEVSGAEAVAWLEKAMEFAKTIKS